MSVLRRIMMMSKDDYTDRTILYKSENAIYPQGIKVLSNRQKGGIWYLIPSKKITIIPNGAFASQPMTDITLPEGVEELGGNCFSYCSELAYVKLPASLKKINSLAFDGVNISEVDYMGEDISNWMNIQYGDLNSCPFYDGDGGVLKISGVPVTTLRMPIYDDSINIPQRSFLGCNSITEIKSNSIVSSINIGDYAFYKCGGLERVTLSSDNIEIGRSAFAESSIHKLEIPDYIVEPSRKPKITIGSLTFSNCKNLKLNIQDFRFFNNLPYACFRGCASLTGISAYCDIGEEAFKDCSELVEANLGSLVTAIGANAFNGTKLNTINIPSGVQNLEYSSFIGCPLGNISVDDNHPVFDSRENCGAIVNTATNSIVIGGINTVIPDSITKIEIGAFYGRKLNEFIIPKNVTVVDLAFRDAEINRLELYGGVRSNYQSSAPFYNAKINTLKVGAFMGEDSLYNAKVTILEIGSETVGADSYSFRYLDCDKLHLTDLFSYLTTLNVRNASDAPSACCKALMVNEVDTNELLVPSEVTTIKPGVFAGALYLTNVRFEGSISNIGHSAFLRCQNIKFFDFSNNITIPTTSISGLGQAHPMYGLSTTCKIIVPDSLYDEWIVAENWSEYADHIIKKSDWDAQQVSE